LETSHFIWLTIRLKERERNHYVLWSLNSIYITSPRCLKATYRRVISMRFMCISATFIALCTFARVTTCRELHQRRFRTPWYGSPLLRIYRVLSYGTHDPFLLTITPLLSSRLAHTSLVDSPFDRPHDEKGTHACYCHSRCNNKYREV